MFNLWSMFNQVETTPKYIEDIPVEFLMTRQEMLDEAAMEYLDGEISFIELIDECEMINYMHDKKEGN